MAQTTRQQGKQTSIVVTPAGRSAPVSVRAAAGLRSLRRAVNVGIFAERERAYRTGGRRKGYGWETVLVSVLPAKGKDRPSSEMGMNELARLARET